MRSKGGLVRQADLLPGQRSLFDPPAEVSPVEVQPAVIPVVRKVAEVIPVVQEVTPARENEWAGIKDLEALKPKVLACSACELRSGARGVVFGEGDPKADIMFVGEGPGQTEDETGRPFVGRAGKLLDAMLESIGLQRKEVFIANIVKCRPPGNRLPLPPEVEVCLPNLRAQIRIVDPKIIVLLGALASQTLINPALRVTRDRGKWFNKDGRNFLVTFHPAAVLRDEYGKKGLLQNDFSSLKQRLEHLRYEADRRPH
ncbi:MAG: uracil-DNA glycosylase [Bacillota bacterium]